MSASLGWAAVARCTATRLARSRHCAATASIPLPGSLLPPRRLSSSGPASGGSSGHSSAPFTSCGPPPAAVQSLLAGYGACTTFPVAWGDQDAFGHVNNVQFVRYVETGRVAALLDMAAQRVEGASARDLQRALSSFLSGRGVGVILKTVAVKFRRPLTYPDVVTVGTALAQLQPDRLTLSHVVVSARQRAVVAEGEGTLVCYDYAKREKCALPALVHEAIAQWGKLYAGRTDEPRRAADSRDAPS